jgi:hypothetical protein
LHFPAQSPENAQGFGCEEHKIPGFPSEGLFRDEMKPDVEDFASEEH